MPGGIQFSPELFDTICEDIAGGQSLVAICKSADMPSYTSVMNWLGNATLDAEHKLVEKYARAREAQADYLAYESLDIADDASNDWMERNGKNDAPGWVLNGEHVQRSKLRVDQRRWMAGKLAPKKYGDKLALGGDDQLGPVKITVAWEGE
jgi:hypothetical protein